MSGIDYRRVITLKNWFLMKKWSLLQWLFWQSHAREWYTISNWIKDNTPLHKTPDWGSTKDVICGQQGSVIKLKSDLEEVLESQEI